MGGDFFSSPSRPNLVRVSNPDKVYFRKVLWAKLLISVTVLRGVHFSNFLKNHQAANQAKSVK